MASIPLGMYVPGSSVLHRLDPRTKLVVGLVSSIVLFAVNSPIVVVCVLAAVIVSFVSARIPLAFLTRFMWPLVFVGSFTFIANSFTLDLSAADVSFWLIGVTYGGLARGIYFVARLACIIFGAALLTLTTSPVMLTDALTTLMSPLRKISVPVDDIAMVFSIALRFIPTIAEEADRIILAQTARGAQFETGSLMARIKAWLPVLVPLLIQLFRRADNLAIAMESRCYVSYGRTRLHQLRFGAIDFVALVVTAAGVVTVIAAL